MTGWGGNALKRDKDRIDRLVRKVGKMTGVFAVGGLSAPAAGDKSVSSYYRR